jgi:uncharacterized protein (DUF4415 family)
MPTVRKSKSISRPFSAAEIAAAKAAASRVQRGTPAVEWTKGVVSRGGGVGATIEAIRRTRGPNKSPTKEQVAIRFDREVLVSFRADGPGWQTRMNSALKEWLASRPLKRGATVHSRLARAELRPRSRQASHHGCHAGVTVRAAELRRKVAQPTPC